MAKRIYQNYETETEAEAKTGDGNPKRALRDRELAFVRALDAFLFKLSGGAGWRTVPTLERLAASSAAELIGFAPPAGMTATDLQAAIEELRVQLDDAQTPVWEGGEPSTLYGKFAIVLYGPSPQHYACSKHEDNSFEPDSGLVDDEHWWMAPSLPALVTKVAHALQAESVVVRGHVTSPTRSISNYYDPPFPFEFPAHSGRANCLTPIPCRALPASSGLFDTDGCVMYLAAAADAEGNYMPADRALGFWARIFADGEANYIRIYSSSADAAADTNVRAFGAIASGTGAQWVLLHRGSSATNDTFGWIYAPRGWNADVEYVDGSRWGFRMAGDAFSFRKAFDAVPGKTFILDADVNLDIANVGTGGEPSAPVSLRPQVWLGRRPLNDEDGEAGGFEYDFPIDPDYSGTQHCRLRAVVTVLGVDEQYLQLSTRLQILHAEGIDTEKSVLEQVEVIPINEIPDTAWFSLLNRITFDSGSFDLVLARATMKVISGGAA